MKLYYLQSMAKSDGDVVEITDKKNRISGYFIWNGNDGKFLQFTKPKGTAQEFLKKTEIIKSDYIVSNISVPIFSSRASEIFRKEIPDEVDFNEIEIISENTKLIFFLCKCRNFYDLLNKEASVFRPLTDGSLILSHPVFKKFPREEFYIARDINNPQVVVVSEKFLDLCKKHNLQIDFLETDQK